MNKHKVQIQQKEDDLEKANAGWKEAMNNLRKDHKRELAAKENEIHRIIGHQVSKQDVSTQAEMFKPNKDVLVQTDEMDENSNPNDQQQNNVLNANPFPEEQYYEFEDQVIWIKNLMEMQQEF
jgi:exonuclease VII small subunit